MPHLVVIGGGITGLTAAFRASQREGLEVTLLEGRDDVGGKIGTVELEGARVELSADSFLPRDDAPLRLCRDIGIADELVEPVDFGGWLYRSGTSAPLPSGTVLGFPTSARAALRARVLSPAARLRAAAEILHRTPLRGGDVSVADFTRARFGSQVLDRLVDPLLAGTRAGDPAEISLAAAIPLVDAAARSNGSVIRGLAQQRPPGSGPPRFYAPRGGMCRLIEALEARMRTVDVRRGTRASALRANGSGLAVDLDSETITADAVIVATPARDAAALVRPVSSAAATELDALRSASAAVLGLLVPADRIELPPSGSGVLVPSSEATTISGCTWFSKKWPAAAAPGYVTIRCFVGRGMRDPALDLSDADLTGVVLHELTSILGPLGEPAAVRVVRWNDAMPVYDVGHLDRVDRIAAALARSSVAVAGASYRGSGIPDCVAQAEAAVAGLVETLRR